LLKLGRVKIQLKEFEMPQPKNKPDSYFPPKKEPQPLNKNIKETGQTSGVSSENNVKKEESPNLFEDHIRGEKKEGA
jgi:hypothetical protein